MTRTADKAADKLQARPLQEGEKVHLVCVQVEDGRERIVSAEEGVVVKSTSRTLVTAYPEYDDPREKWQLKTKPDGISTDDSDETVYIARPTRRSSEVYRRSSLVEGAKGVYWSDVPNDVIADVLRLVKQRAPKALEIAS